MNKKLLFLAGWITGCVLISTYMIFNTVRHISYNNGWREGVEWHREQNKKYDCEVKFDRVPYKDISGECIKYFMPESKQNQ